MGLAQFAGPNFLILLNITTVLFIELTNWANCESKINVIKIAENRLWELTVLSLNNFVLPKNIILVLVLRSRCLFCNIGSRKVTPCWSNNVNSEIPASERTEKRLFNLWSSAVLLHFVFPVDSFLICEKPSCQKFRVLGT